MLRAVLNDTPYPATLLNGVTLRIRAERRGAPVAEPPSKSLFYKTGQQARGHESPDCTKGGFDTCLSTKTATNVPYTLGRLFSVLEAIQQYANPGINSTIKDKYFNSAAATPAVIFPTLINLAQKHLKKLRGPALAGHLL